MAHSPPLPGEEGAGTAMAGCWVVVYGVQCAQKILCRRQWAECVWQEMPSHPVLLTVSGGKVWPRTRHSCLLPAVLADCNKLQESPNHPERMSKA